MSDGEKIAALEFQLRARGMPLLELEATPTPWVTPLEQSKGRSYTVEKLIRVTAELWLLGEVSVREVRISEFGVWVTVDYVPFGEGAARMLQEKRDVLRLAVHAAIQRLERDTANPPAPK